MKTVYNKLVRDDIPKHIRESGKTCHIVPLTTHVYIMELKKKLCEEAQEVFDAIDQEDVIEELGDVLEVIDALKDIYKIDDEKLKEAKDKKAKEKGRFEKRLFLQDVETEDE